jgi:hypothetical protein
MNTLHFIEEDPDPSKTIELVVLKPKSEIFFFKLGIDCGISLTTPTTKVVGF